MGCFSTPIQLLIWSNLARVIGQIYHSEDAAGIQNKALPLLWLTLRQWATKVVYWQKPRVACLCTWLYNLFSLTHLYSIKIFKKKQNLKFLYRTILSLREALSQLTLLIFKEAQQLPAQHCMIILPRPNRGLLPTALQLLLPV